MADIIVVGGGHAGVEAAAAAARMGLCVSLVTYDIHKIGVMSCNPAIGGIGKGHLVKEIDALDGIMGLAADAAGIQFKILNSSKGPAVHGPRCQADRNLYKKAVMKELLKHNSIDIVSCGVDGLIFSNGECRGVYLSDGKKINADSVIITSGTFLNGLIHIGSKKISAGRINEKHSLKLAEDLNSLNLPMRRLKTGTPPRLRADSINWSLLEKEFGDKSPEPFSSLGKGIVNPQVPCYVTWTNKTTHKIIKESFDKSPMFNGSISSLGPRYCPSIEDKVKRFYDRDKHRVVLEPETLKGDIIYPNGISTSLPEEVQKKFLQTMIGLENTEIIQPGYAIEYDHVDPRALRHSLELKSVPRLFLAGQINGTTGYEEAAGQGLIAGINAALRVKGKNPWVPDRADGYLGVMIDDLVTRGTPEPYRMFTSRAEYRLLLRSDNADQRLTKKGISLGIVRSEREKKFNKYISELEKLKGMLLEKTITPTKAKKYDVFLSEDGRKRDASEILGYAEVGIQTFLKIWPSFGDFSKKLLLQASIECKYKNHILKQSDHIAAYRKDKNLSIPMSLDYKKIGGLSEECRVALITAKPENLAAASRIPGITPAALTSVLVYTRKLRTKSNVF